MKILIMGSGAVGGYYGAVLDRASNNVTFVARGEHLAAIKERGLRIQSVTSGDFAIKPRAIERPDGSWRAELVLYCVKGYDNDEAISAMRPAVDDGTSILTLQNGIGSGDVLAGAFGRDKVLLGVTYVDATRKEPGVIVEEGGPCNIVFGEPGGGRTARAEAVLGVLKGAGIAVELSDNVEKALWTKLIYICALSGMMCITRASFTEVLENPETLDLTWIVMREAEAVAKAKGVEVDDDVLESTMAQFQEAKGRLMSSMYTDLQRGNRLEVAVMNCAVASLGKELGVATPVNEFITACLSVAHNRAASQQE